MGIGRWARLLSKSYFGIEQNKYGDIEFRISQIIGDTKYASKYLLSARFASDEIVFNMALDRFLEEFEKVILPQES